MNLRSKWRRNCVQKTSFYSSAFLRANFGCFDQTAENSTFNNKKNRSIDLVQILFVIQFIWVLNYYAHIVRSTIVSWNQFHRKFQFVKYFSRFVTIYNMNYVENLPKLCFKRNKNKYNWIEPVLNAPNIAFFRLINDVDWVQISASGCKAGQKC